ARTVSARPTAANDHEGVRHVLTRYCHALDRGRLDEVGALFHRDAVFSVSFEGGQQHTGRAAIQAWYERFFHERPGQYHHMRHKIFEPLVTVNGVTATTSTYFDADSVAAEGTVQVVAGRYDDTLTKEQGQWFFKERIITVFYHYSPGNCQEGM
ncbi:MAG: nuclear transport factor 2 family protein, partial [Candidatus Binatia bacterium]